MNAPQSNTIILLASVTGTPVRGEYNSGTPWCVFHVKQEKARPTRGLEKRTKFDTYAVRAYAAGVIDLAEGDLVHIVGTLEQQFMSEGPVNPGQLYISSNNVQRVAPAAADRHYEPATD